MSIFLELTTFVINFVENKKKNPFLPYVIIGNNSSTSRIVVCVISLNGFVCNAQIGLDIKPVKLLIQMLKRQIVLFMSKYPCMCNPCQVESNFRGSQNAV